MAGIKIVSTFADPKRTEPLGEGSMGERIQEYVDVNRMVFWGRIREEFIKNIEAQKAR